MTEISRPDGARLRLARQARGLSQQQLAGMAGVTRQAVSAVESGHSDPSLRVALGLARALGMTVEELFGPGDLGDPVLAQPVAAVNGPGSRVALATVGDTFVALPLHADTAARRASARRAGWWRARRRPGGRVWRAARAVEPGAGPAHRPAAADRRGGRLRSGAAAARDAALPARPAPGVRLVAVRQRRGLAPGRRRTGARRGRAPSWTPWPRAGPLTTRRNRAAADIPGGAEVVGFASWREGLVVRPGTQVRGLDDVAARGLRLVNREPGAQARALLDRERLRLRLDPAELPGYDSRAAGHLQVAAAIAGGLADAGVSSEPAALAYGLDFIPLAAERFDLVLPAKHAASREVQGLLRVLTSPWLLAQLASLPGYDAGRCGERPS